MGRGGVGDVYRAFDPVRQRLVALKTLRLDAETRHREERIAQFHREYRTLAEFSHPSTIRVFDYGVDALGPYYTMELLDGEDLSARVPRPWREACSLGRDVCSSLALLHARGYLHRDVSPLNVRCTGDGRAKLIDFGAMVPMGISSLTMGTPPFVAPEALARQPMDGRTDLFSLGGTLYFALTGRHAYPARTLQELSLLHQQSPHAPSRYARDIPSALDSLVLSLLSIDPMARPRHAAEVMDRLTILAELRPIEPIGVQSAYLNRPALVGRSAAIEQLADQLRRARAARGGALRIHAAEGGGRSRLLYSAAMEARLQGMLVLQASASLGEATAFQVVRALLDALRYELSSGSEAVRSSSALPALLAKLPEIAPGPADHESTLHALAEAIVQLARTQPILIAVDDIQQCDERSLALFVTLAARIRREPFALIFTDTNTDAADTQPACGLLRELARGIELEPLPELETEALLESVFGEVPNLQTLARYVHERALGNPRATMELAQALVDRGVLHYELGSWSLPGEFATDALPATLLEVRRAKLSELSADARELVRLLVLTDGYGLDIGELAQLSERVSMESSSAARQELLDAHVIASPEQQALADRTWFEIVRQELQPDWTLRVHERLAQLLTRKRASPIHLCRCWLRADEPRRALEVLTAAIAKGSLAGHADAAYPELLQECVVFCKRLERPARERYLLSRELVGLADRVILKDQGECFAFALARLRLDSGLADIEALPDTADRLGTALAAAQARYDASPEHERVLTPIDAIRDLAETVYLAAVYAAIIGDMRLLDSLPDLTPFEPLSPAIMLVTSALGSQRALIGARYEDALDAYHARFAALEDTRRHLSPEQFERSRLLYHYVLGALQAGLSIPGALAHADALDALPDGAVMAAAVRESHHVRRGNTRAAKQWRRRFELLQIQHGRPHALKLRRTTQQVECSAQADDLEETKRNMEVLEELVAFYPCAQAYLDYARGSYDRIRGDYTAGLRHARRALAACSAGVDPVWPWAACCEVECLRELGRLEEARAVGIQQLERAHAAGLRVVMDHVVCFVALVEGQLGLFESAVRRLDHILLHMQDLGIEGINIGWPCEVRARVALWMKDREAFAIYASRTAHGYGGGRDNPALAARYERLMQDARAVWGGTSSLQPSRLATLSLVPSNWSAEHSITMRTELARFHSSEQRAQHAFTQLAAAAHAQHGQLFLLREHGLVLVAGTDAPAELAQLAARLIAPDLGTQTSDVATVSEVEDSTQAPAAYRSTLLLCQRGTIQQIVGVVSLDSHHSSPELERMTRELAEILIELGDATPRIQ